MFHEILLGHVASCGFCLPLTDLYITSHEKKPMATCELANVGPSPQDPPLQLPKSRGPRDDGSEQRRGFPELFFLTKKTKRISRYSFFGWVFFAGILLMCFSKSPQISSQPIRGQQAGGPWLRNVA